MPPSAAVCWSSGRGSLGRWWLVPLPSFNSARRDAAAASAVERMDAFVAVAAMAAAVTGGVNAGVCPTAIATAAAAATASAAAAASASAAAAAAAAAGAAAADACPATAWPGMLPHASARRRRCSAVPTNVAEKPVGMTATRGSAEAGGGGGRPAAGSLYANCHRPSALTDRGGITWGGGQRGREAGLVVCQLPPPERVDRQRGASIGEGEGAQTGRRARVVDQTPHIEPHTSLGAVRTVKAACGFNEWAWTIVGKRGLACTYARVWKHGICTYARLWRHGMQAARTASVQVTCATVSPAYQPGGSLGLAEVHGYRAVEAESFYCLAKRCEILQCSGQQYGATTVTRTV
eukprot:350051-Chlamydomonas_euryale.AAC.4